MNVELQRVPYEHKQALANLMELCQHDYNEFNGRDLNEHGLYGYKYLDHYWTEPSRHPFFIKADGQLAGFAMIREIEGGWQMAEFFIVRKYRGQGAGRRAAELVFQMFPGKWDVSQTEQNTVAQAFWRRVIDRVTGGLYTETREDGTNTIRFER